MYISSQCEVLLFHRIHVTHWTKHLKQYTYIVYSVVAHGIACFQCNITVTNNNTGEQWGPKAFLTSYILLNIINKTLKIVTKMV